MCPIIQTGTDLVSQADYSCRVDEWPERKANSSLCIFPVLWVLGLYSMACSYNLEIEERSAMGL